MSQTNRQALNSLRTGSPSFAQPALVVVGVTPSPGGSDFTPPHPLQLEKRKRGTFGPPAGKKFLVHVDDMNMPKREVYGAQPPIEILRQWFDQGGWYDRHGDLGFRSIIDMVFVASMGPPGGGRQEVTPRFLRHFNIVGLVETSNTGKSTMFGTILRDFVGAFAAPVQQCCDAMVESTIEIFDSVAASLLPTPLKSHYTFNLRDLAKVFQGMLMASPKRIETKDQWLRMWVHGRHSSHHANYKHYTHTVTSRTHPSTHTHTRRASRSW